MILLLQLESLGGVPLFWYPRSIYRVDRWPASKTDAVLVGGIDVTFQYERLHIEEPKRTRELKHPSVCYVVSSVNDDARHDVIQTLFSI